jgi:hypothetical protein
MYKISTLLIVFFPFVTRGQAPIVALAYTPGHAQVLHFDDRDAAGHIYMDSTQSNNVWQIGIPSKTIFNSPITTPLALMTDTINNYPNDNLSSFYFTVYTDDYTNIAFWHRMQTDSLSDGGVVEVSMDGGTTWINILSSSFAVSNYYTVGSSIASNGGRDGFTGVFDWTYSALTGYALNNVKFRFTFSSDGTNTNKEGWMIDELEVSCIGTGIVSFGNDNGINVFPNPAKNNIQFFANDNTVIEKIIVHDFSGKTIATTMQSNINLTEFSTGLYIAQVFTNSGVFLKRFVKE